MTMISPEPNTLGVRHINFLELAYSTNEPVQSSPQITMAVEILKIHTITKIADNWLTHYILLAVPQVLPSYGDFGPWDAFLGRNATHHGRIISTHSHRPTPSLPSTLVIVGERSGFSLGEGRGPAGQGALMRQCDWPACSAIMAGN